MTETAIPRLVHSDAAKAWATSPERVPLFSVEAPNPDFDPNAPVAEGQDSPPRTIVNVYTMPAKPNAGLALDFLRRARREGELAMSWLIETAVGNDGYDALVDELAGIEDPAEAQAVLRGIVERIQRVAMGGLDGSGPKA